jgi:hypothetical protein
MEPHEHEALGNKLVGRIIVCEADILTSRFFVFERKLRVETRWSGPNNPSYIYHVYDLDRKVFVEIQRDKECILSLLKTGEYKYKHQDIKDHLI